MLVSFQTSDVGEVAKDFAILGITGEFAKTSTGSGNVVAHYEPGRTALKLREYIESHHFSDAGGHFERLPVDGWDDLIRNAALH